MSEIEVAGALLPAENHGVTTTRAPLANELVAATVLPKNTAMNIVGNSGGSRRPSVSTRTAKKPRRVGALVAYEEARPVTCAAFAGRVGRLTLRAFGAHVTRFFGISANRPGGHRDS
jgi:hypothetical protein